VLSNTLSLVQSYEAGEMARARLKRITPKGPKRSRKKRIAWDTATLKVLLKRDKRAVGKISEEEIANLRSPIAPSLTGGLNQPINFTLG
jgi:hypothetical protein